MILNLRNLMMNNPSEFSTIIITYLQFFNSKKKYQSFDLFFLRFWHLQTKKNVKWNKIENFLKMMIMIRFKSQVSKKC